MSVWFLGADAPDLQFSWFCTAAARGWDGFVTRLGNLTFFDGLVRLSVDFLNVVQHARLALQLTRQSTEVLVPIPNKQASFPVLYVDRDLTVFRCAAQLHR